jgi:hypothetical protein
MKKRCGFFDAYDISTQERLCDISQKACYFYLDSDIFIDGLESVLNAAKQLIQQEPSVKDRKKPPKYSSLWMFTDNLVPIYKEVTGKNAGATNSESSKFANFVFKCVELTIDNDTLYSEQSVNRVVVKVIAYRKFKARQEKNISDQIPLTETEEGMLKALYEARAKNAEDNMNFIKKSHKR